MDEGLEDILYRNKPLYENSIIGAEDNCRFPMVPPYSFQDRGSTIMLSHDPLFPVRGKGWGLFLPWHIAQQGFGWLDGPLPLPTACLESQPEEGWRD
jgi:hypothetical protein